MEKHVDFTEMLNIEKQILKVYDKLIELSENKNEGKKINKEYRKQIDILDLLVEYEQKKLEIFMEDLDERAAKRFIDMYNADYVYTRKIIDNKNLHKIRLAFTLVTLLNIKVMDSDMQFMNNFMTELIMKYIWNINKKKNEKNKEIITKIQYYNCFLDRRIESFFIDNFFDFESAHYLVHMQSLYDDTEEEEITYGDMPVGEVLFDEDFFNGQALIKEADIENRTANIVDQLTFSLDRLKGLKKGTFDYMCEQEYIKSFTQTAYEGELEEYYNNLEKEEKSVMQKIIKNNQQW